MLQTSRKRFASSSSDPFINCKLLRLVFDNSVGPYRRGLLMAEALP